MQLSVTLQIVRLLLTQKFSKILQFLGLCLRSDCTSHIVFFSKNTCCIKLYFEFDYFDCLLHFYNQKIVPTPMTLLEMID